MMAILGWVLCGIWVGGTGEVSAPAPVVQGPGMAASPTRTPAKGEKQPSLRVTCQPRSSAPMAQSRLAQPTSGSQVINRCRWPAEHRRAISAGGGKGPTASAGGGDRRLVIGERRFLHWLPLCDAQHGRLHGLLTRSPPPVNTAGRGNS